MPVDAGIYGQFAPRVQSVSEIQNGLAQQQANALSAQHSGLQIQQMQTDMADNNALRAAYRGGANPTTAEGRQALIQAAPLQAPKIFQQQADLAKANAAAAASNAQATNHTADTKIKNMDVLSRQFAGINPMDDQALAGVLHKSVELGINKPEEAQAEAERVQKMAPDDRLRWYSQQLQQGMSIKDQMAQKLQQDTLKETVRGHDLTYTASRQNNTDTNRTHLQGIGIQQAGENTRSAASRAIETVKADPYGDLGLNKNVPQSVTTGAGLTGDAYLQTLSPAVQNQVKMMADGKIPITAMALRSPQVMALLRMASQYDPGTDATTYQSRAKTATDFSSGGKSGQQLTNANLALHHAGQLSDAIDKLNNSDFLPGITNPISNLAAQKLGGDTSQGVYKQKADALSSELRKLYAGSGGGSLKELESWQSTFDENASKTQQKAYLKSGMELLTGAIQSKQEAYDRGMGGRGDFAKMLSPESLKVLQRLAPDYAATLGGGKSAPAPNAPAGWKIEKVK